MKTLLNKSYHLPSKSHHLSPVLWLIKCESICHVIESSCLCEVWGVWLVSSPGKFNLLDRAGIWLIVAHSAQLLLLHSAKEQSVRQTGHGF